jgi:hypothetical protein
MPRYQEYDDSEEAPGAEPEDEGGPKPIGVPEEYPIPGGVPGPGQRPLNPAFTGDKPTPTGRYMDGDEWIPANYPGDMVYMLQQQLVQAGLLTSNFTSGVYDPATREAYKQLLGLANAQGEDANMTLSQMVANASAIPQPAEPLLTQTTDPAVLRQAFRRSIIDLTGEGWSRDQINDMVGAYNQLERQRQQEAFNLEQSGMSGNVVATPSPMDFIETQVQEQNPEGVQEEEALGFLNDFLQTVGGGWNG